MKLADRRGGGGEGEVARYSILAARYPIRFLLIWCVLRLQAWTREYHF